MKRFVYLGKKNRDRLFNWAVYESDSAKASLYLSLCCAITEVSEEGFFGERGSTAKEWQGSYNEIVRVRDTLGREILKEIKKS